jgi:glycosyltransferase involved in cell wall biosynthesis/SAM-dependent methyltransferase
MTEATSSPVGPDLDACERLGRDEFFSRFLKAPVEEVTNACPAEPLVSVVIPTHNHVRFIAQTLDSILAQEVDFPFEICVGDDDSRDGTREICLDYARRHPGRIRLFLVPRANNIAIGGLATGRFNLAYLLFQARGRYIAWCEGDDYWIEPRKLARQVEFLECNPDYALTFHDARVYYEDHDGWRAKHTYAKFPWCHLEPARRLYGARELIESPVCPTASVLLRRPKVWQFPLWLFHVPSGDIPIEVAVTGAAKVYNFGECWSAYRKHKGGITAHHRGNMIHVGRIMTYLGLFCELGGGQRAPIATVIEKHVRELEAPLEPYAPVVWDSLLKAALDVLDRSGASDASADALRKCIVTLQSRRTERNAAVVGRIPATQVLFLAHGPGQVNGPNIWLTRLLPALKERGYAPRVFMFMTRVAPCSIADKLRAAGIPCEQRPFGYTEDMVQAILRHMQEHACAVFVPNLNVQGYFAASLLKAAGIPTVGVLHSDDDFHRDLTDEFIRGQGGRHLSAAVSVSVFQHEALLALDHGPTKIVRAPYGAPVPEAFARHRAKPFRFVYVGRLVEEQKRVSDMLRAMIAVLQRQPDAEFHLCGDGTARPAVEALIKDSGLGSRIRLHGNLSPDEVRRVLLDSQAMVLLSDYEGIPIALMEAMGCGVVPICTKIRSGIGEVIRDGENGLLVSDRAEGFVAAAERLLQDPVFWARCSVAARTVIQKNFSVEANADTWAQLLGELQAAAPRSRQSIELPSRLDLPPVRTNPKGIAREDRRKPQTALSTVTPTAPHPFTNPPLEPNNADLYWVRSSILRAVQQALPQFHGTFLDIGCGVMPYRELITRAPSRVTRYIGLDIETPTYRAEVDMRWDGRSIPLPDASVDCAMATEVLEHCPEPLVVMKEARRVLKPGGVFFFTVPYIWPLHDAPYDFYRYTPFALERLLAEAGFADVQIQAMGGWNASLAQMLGLWLKRAPLAPETRNQMAKQLWPLYQELVKTDVVPVNPKAGNTMTTGWSGVVRVPQTADTTVFTPETAVQVVSVADKRGDLPVVLVRSHEYNYSETFVEDHVNHLTRNLTLLCGFPFPRFVKNGRSVLPEALETKLQSALTAGKGVTADLWRDYTAALSLFFKSCGAESALVETGLMGAFVHEACEQAGLPYVVHFHGVDAFGQELLGRWQGHYRKFFPKAAAVVAVSKAMRGQLIKLGAPAERVLLAPYGVSVDLPKQAEPAKAPPQFVAVGRFVEKKAPHLTLQAFAAVHQLVPKARLVMIGDGPLLAPCQQWVRENGVANAVTFAGVQSREEVSRWMASGRVFVQHSVTAPNGDSEGLPLAILEAGAHGLPVVSTRHAGIPDAVREGMDGFLVAEQDVEGMTQAMLRLAREPGLAEKLGASFRERVAANYSRERSLTRLLNILKAAARDESTVRLGEPVDESAAAPVIDVVGAAAPVLEAVAPVKSGPRAMVAEDRNNHAAYLELGRSLLAEDKLGDAYLAVGEAHRLTGGTPETRDLLQKLEERGALGEPVVEAYRRRAGWLPRRKSAQTRRIIVVTNLLPPQEMGGYGRTVWEFSRELQARGHTVRVLTADLSHLVRKPTAEHEAFESSVCRVLRLYGDWKDGVVQVEQDQTRIREILRANHETILSEVKKFRPDAIMAGNLDLVGYSFIQEMLNRGIPVVHRLGNAYPGYEPAQAPNSPLFCLAGCSAWVNDNLRAKAYPITRYAVLPPGSPLTDYFRAFAPQRERLRIAFASLLMPYKGAHVLVEALALLCRLGIDFECTIAGDTTSADYVNKLRAFAQAQGFADRLSFSGFLAKRELAALFARSNVLVFPSVFEEPFGKTQIEAMAAGLAVVSSGSGGAREIIRDGETGLLFKGGDSRDLAEKLVRLHRQPDYAAKLAAAGQADVFRFTTGASVDRLETLFQELITAARRKSPQAASVGT